jgi:hypothetical protein
MQKITVSAARTTSAALLAPLMVTIAACAPARPQLHSSAIGVNPRFAVLRDDQPWGVQPCFVATQRCLTMDPRSWGPCLVSTERCSADARVEPIATAPR